MNIKTLVKKAEQGFSQLDVGQKYQDQALTHLETWLTNDQFQAYQPQIKHLIEAEHWDYLLDCFYQVMPFGTGGKRGEVGIGPNRINSWNIQASAQGHAQYLLKQYKDEAKNRGVVLTFDVRQFFSNKFFNPDLPNPVRGLTCEDLAQKAAEVYVANGIKVYLFEDFRSTPELSFAIRHLNAVGGDMFSASHNPPEHNGKKIYDEHGGQLTPPFDENLVTEVTENVSEIKRTDFDQAVKKGLIELVGTDVDQAYWQACQKISLSQARDLKIVYTPLHGCGITSVPPVLEQLGFEVKLDPETSYPSGKFENVTFNIPNPEVEQSFETSLEFAKKERADILLNSDPDADRIGIMIDHHGDWKFINGNEIASIITEYVIAKKRDQGFEGGTTIKTQVTTNLITEICQQNGVQIIGDLLVGFKYIGNIMNQLESEGNIDQFLLGCEESHGYIAGNYARDKDAVVAAVWLSELAAELKAQGKTLLDYLNQIYAKYGYYRNYLTEIRLPGAEGMTKIQKVLSHLRQEKPQQFGKYLVTEIDDWRDRKPIVSETDRQAKSGMVFKFKPVIGTKSIRVTVRPSGTEPKVKMYFEIGSEPFNPEQTDQIKTEIEELLKDLEKDFMNYCYQILGVEFPERGFLLFWQLPLKDKLKYFELEPEVAKLKTVKDAGQRKKQLMTMLEFLGSDPIKKFNAAFKAKYGQDLTSYLEI